MTEETFPDCWLFDSNRRVYREGGGGGPVYREHWRKVEITGSTSRSWVTSWDQKIPKKGRRGVAFSQEEVDADVWIHSCSYGVSEAVRNCGDYEKLKKIAEILEWKEQ